ncbi:MAG: glycosyltransferase family 2 protein [Candidatus Velamenicoccus archaeovorus]
MEATGLDGLVSEREEAGPPVRESPGAHAPGAAPADDVSLSIVLPCLNEAATLGLCIQASQEAFRSLGIEGEIVVADNGSSDGSVEIAQELGARVVHVPKKGYGAALLGGIAAAQGTYVIMGDADATYDLEAIEPFVERLRAGADLVMGNRFAGGIAKGAMPWLNRRIGNPVLTGLGRLFFHSPVEDFHCGLRGFRRDRILELGLRADGMEFASEMVVKATLAGLRIAEVPTTLARGDRERASHLRPWRDGWRHLRFMLLFSPRWLFLYPGLLLMAAGLSGTLWLLPGPRVVGGVTFDVQTLLFACMTIAIGFQAVLFSLLGKVFAWNEGLIPVGERFRNLFRYLTLEVGLAVGILWIVAGALGAVYAFVRWSEVSFGPLDASRNLRIVIPSLTALLLGAQIVLSSFFFSLLGLPRHRGTTVGPSGTRATHRID